MQHRPKIRNKDQPHAGILACTALFLYGSQLRHATAVNRNYRTGLPRTLSTTQQFYSALRGVRRRFTSLPGARNSARLAQRGLLRRRRYFRWPSPDCSFQRNQRHLIPLTQMKETIPPYYLEILAGNDTPQRARPLFRYQKTLR